MTSFVALNIEPDDYSEEEVDDTKEIQIEEALKLYHNALKLHSQGPQFYDQASEAYEALFKSEIFNYPESISEYKRSQLEGPDTQYESFLEKTAPGSAVPLDASDTISSALPQTLYLSHKNRGQFMLDHLGHLLRTKRSKADDGYESIVDISATSSSAIKSFAEALERDDTDLELWRKSARIGDALQSNRLARFCLESVLEGDDDGFDDGFEQLGLEQAFAIEDLRQVLNILSDELSMLQRPQRRPRKAILRLLQKQTDSFPYLPRGLSVPSTFRNLLGVPPSRHVVSLTCASWTALGGAVLQALRDEQEGRSSLTPGAALGISVQDCRELIEISPFSLPLLQRNAATAKQGDRANQSLDIGVPDAGELHHALRLSAESSNKDRASIASDSDNREPSPHPEQVSETYLESPQHKVDEKPEEKISLLAQDEAKQTTAAPQSRKRSSASAGNDEHPDGGRMKSRRIRARESNAEVHAPSAPVPFDAAKYFEEHLEQYVHADQWMFGVVGALLSKAGVEDLGTIDELQDILCSDSDQELPDNNIRDYIAQRVLYNDLRKIIEIWDDKIAQVALNSDIFSMDSTDGIDGTKRSGMSIFLDHSRQCHPNPDEVITLVEDDGLSPFLEHINGGWFCPREAAFLWLEQHLKPNPADQLPSERENQLMGCSSYTNRLWTKDMKEAALKILTENDEFIYTKLNNDAMAWEQAVLASNSTNNISPSQLQGFAEITQSIYELHLDIYASMNGAGSADGDHLKVLEERDRLARWSTLARSFINYQNDVCLNKAMYIAIELRHLWASVFHLNLTEEVPRNYVFLCLQDLRHVLVALGGPSMLLLNNLTMPEISISAIDEEISRLNSMDFFTNLFSSDSDDPLRLIESIEPILDPSSVEFVNESLSAEEFERPMEKSEPRANYPLMSTIQGMISFLDRGDATLRLFLWRRLKGAYESIQYFPKVVSCYLRSIEIIAGELQNPSFLKESSEHRQISLLKWIKTLDDLLSKVVGKMIDEPEKSFECFDVAHLQSSMSAVVQISKLLHSFALFEDSIRVGQVTVPDIRPASTAKTLEQFKGRLRGMQVKIWVLLYALLREFMEQNKELFDTPNDDRIHYLRSVHNALGIRSYCKYSNKLLLRLLKKELLTLPSEDSYEFDVSQVLFDLYGLKFLNLDDIANHGCPIERLDRSSAVMMIDFVMTQVNRMNIKDVHKSELKPTIDTMQMAIGRATKFSTPLTFNKRVLSAFLKSPINPSDLFRAVQGIGEVSMIPVQTDSLELAEKGWYFLLGSIFLSKFRAQKRITAIPTDDLDVAASFFRQELEHGTGKWETWYRLAQVYDLKLEEDIAWSADKLNNNRSDLAVLQRRAIHCFTMAVAAAIRTADSSPESKRKISDLYTEFGFRMYASATEPLSMEAFSLMEFTRHYTSGENQQMYKAKLFPDMNKYSAWNFASYLFRRATDDRPNYWKNYYMFSKCLWKMFCCDGATRGQRSPVEFDDVLDSLVDAIEALPSKRDSRSDPILEPHFKLVSIVHKLVQRGILKAEDARERLLATPYARNVNLNNDGWKPYILEVLRNLRSADKSNWHHRIVLRVSHLSSLLTSTFFADGDQAAHVLYDDSKDDSSAMAAKSEISQQIFTKTMTLQVWRPENERAGRHFVYTTRYVYFFVGLLNQLNDRANLDMLIRRVRRKPNDYVHHSKLWEDICLTYVKLFRRVGEIPEGHEETVFKLVSHDEFAIHCKRLEDWCQHHSSETQLVDLLKDAVELKKLNNGLMKTAIFEELVADTYAVLFQSNISKFMEQATEEENHERMKVDHLLMVGEGPEGNRTPPVSATHAQPGPKPRFKGVTRKELQRKAEAIATRALAPKPAPKTSVRQAEEETSTVKQQEAIEIAIPSLPSKEEVSGIQSSVPGSVHDSADNESELSEIDEAKVLVELGEVATTRATTAQENTTVKRNLSPKPASDGPSTNVSLADGAEVESGPATSAQDTKLEFELKEAEVLDVDMEENA
ncbi:conserved hypothetical protein [Histoplasma capsulatum G186AR]|uniref:Histone transcription regulator 3 homolog n=1 Tax=Ajellomyces capsulatus (strain G186AR / H82 / ATCC MYA-2454 / RMSCC 2432) TaxID=447093 RepID=C0NW09_AJECG|nr:uncharacterized protein HCBG_07339 [Histoplasma capsulatum G186AR]EEH04114.1 conserved hypothetical protein [Histoplasma capsulatum G186AR]